MSEERSLNFIEEIVEEDLKNGKVDQIKTRFPPEPNGYLHIGHAKSIVLNFGLAKKYGGSTNLRFDDTNPVTEETEYVESIKQDVRWLGFEWANELYASNYFEQLYQFAENLIAKGLAYVDDSLSEAIAKEKGTPTQPGHRNQYAYRTAEENLGIFREMRDGKFPDGAKVLRVKGDMTSSNMLMRDPIIYRIKHAHHHRTGDTWCIYPMYDFAHGQSDSIEGITHSVCTLEFIPHRELYNFLIENLEIFPSRQYEFARLNMTYTVMSKRKLLQLVTEKFVESWDDPRMPTISGMRRRGYPAKAIREFCDRIGVAKRENMIDVGLLEFFVREDLNKTALRRMAVLDPVKLVISNYPEGEHEMLPSENNPEMPETGDRMLPFGKELWIEREDFMEEASKKWFRLAPGAVVRLKSAYIVRCTGFEKDEAGVLTTVFAEYIPESKSGNDTSGIHAKGTMHWISAAHAGKAAVRLYDRLFQVENPASEEGDFKDFINSGSLTIIENAYVEQDLQNAAPGTAYQFIRKGYFVLDTVHSKEAQLVFNRTVTLKDNWAKASKKG